MAVPPSGRRLVAHVAARRQVLAGALLLAHLPLLLALLMLDVSAVWIGATAGLLVAEGLTLALLLRTEADARRGEEQLTLALWQGHASMRARQEETERIRSDLIATVNPTLKSGTRRLAAL